MTIEKQISRLSKSALTAIVNDLYGRYSDIDDIIAAHIDAWGNPDTPANLKQPGHTLAKSLQRQISHLTSSDDIRDYHGAYDVSYRLHSLLLEVESLAESNPELALESLEALLNRQGDLLNYVDDSNGEVGGALMDGIDLWLQIAASLRAQQPDARDWVQAVLNFFDGNDYGCFDNVISHSRHLLTAEELRQLAWRFEADAKKALQDKRIKGYNHQAAHATIGLHSVAEALDDIALYEKGTLITSPQPNTLQIERIVRFALNINELERADYWLQQPQWQEDKASHNRLLNQLLERQGNIDQLKHNLLQAFNEHPTAFALEAYWDFATPKEQQAIAKQVKTQVTELSDRQEAVQLLLQIKATKQAGQYLVEYHQALQDTWYVTLLAWLEHFEAEGQTLAVVVCYRLLLSDLLKRGKSQAYHHGARYFQQLLVLDKNIKNYKGLDSAADYIRQLQQQHWRKRSFWTAASYPNKPN